MQTLAIYTIGYGARSFSEMVDLLKRYKIGFVVDVRSFPYSRFKPEFSRTTLKWELEEYGFRYVFMGDLLGGRPNDGNCYIDGKVDYARVQETELFHKGIERIQIAWQKQLRICLMCSESRPQDCHRSKLIGQVLERKGMQVGHIDSDGKLRTQREVIRLLTGGQTNLFGDVFTSRKAYRVQLSDSSKRDR